MNIGYCFYTVSLHSFRVLCLSICALFYLEFIIDPYCFFHIIVLLMCLNRFGCVVLFLRPFFVSIFSLLLFSLSHCLYNYVLLLCKYARLLTAALTATHLCFVRIQFFFFSILTICVKSSLYRIVKLITCVIIYFSYVDRTVII